MPLENVLLKFGVDVNTLKRKDNLRDYYECKLHCLDIEVLLISTLNI